MFFFSPAPSRVFFARHWLVQVSSAGKTFGITGWQIGRKTRRWGPTKVPKKGPNQSVDPEIQAGMRGEPLSKFILFFCSVFVCHFPTCDRTHPRSWVFPSLVERKPGRSCGSPDTSAFGIEFAKRVSHFGKARWLKLASLGEPLVAMPSVQCAVAWTSGILEELVDQVKLSAADPAEDFTSAGTCTIMEVQHRREEHKEQAGKQEETTCWDVYKYKFAYNGVWHWSTKPPPQRVGM